ncbi:hypothetical protein EYF80_049999 [Liparis tanakae]|uniref:Uncharacterized protein n=1 Tax=Liparis tanakae TaxID=230148 RepID=A0A4Z2FFA7_9TELE|nr:hypothetical protein EYF80_049999 [Liparis tanakae]
MDVFTPCRNCLGREQDRFSASRMRTCSRTLLALANGSGDGSDGTTLCVATLSKVLFLLPGTARELSSSS